VRINHENIDSCAFCARFDRKCSAEQFWFLLSPSDVISSDASGNYGEFLVLSLSQCLKNGIKNSDNGIIYLKSLGLLAAEHNFALPRRRTDVPVRILDFDSGKLNRLVAYVVIGSLSPCSLLLPVLPPSGISPRWKHCVGSEW
jgi:hypothetical protein